MFHSVVIDLFNLRTTTNSQSVARQALERQSFNPTFDYLERRAIVSETIQPEQTGRVRFQSTWWYAMCPHDVVHYLILQFALLAEVILPLLLNRYPVLFLKL